MTAATLRRTIAAAVLLVAAFAAVPSFIHIQHLATANGQTWVASVLLPFSIDGTVAAASMVMFGAARRGEKPPRLARGMLALSIGATLAANIAEGMPHGLVGATVSGWPAVAFAGAVEMFIWEVRRNAVAAPQPPVARRTRPVAQEPKPVTPDAEPSTPVSAPVAELSESDSIRWAIAQTGSQNPDEIVEWLAKHGREVEKRRTYRHLPPRGKEHPGQDRALANGKVS